MFHSHPGGTATPSMIDVQSGPEPEWMYLIAAPGEIRGFTSAMQGRGDRSRLRSDPDGDDRHDDVGDDGVQAVDQPVRRALLFVDLADQGTHRPKAHAKCCPEGDSIDDFGGTDSA